MTDARYVELHARSAFSFLEGASTPEDLAAACAGFGMPAMALLDRDGVYGSPRFHLAAKTLGIRAHIGSEITCTDGVRYPLLVENRTGYQNLCRLVTRMKLRAKKGEGAATPEELAEFSGGLVCLASEAGPQRLERVIRMFGRSNVYAEVQRHLNRDQERRNQAIIQTARGLGIALVATNGASHISARQREVLDVLTCVRNKVTLETAGRLLAQNSERHLKTAAEMARLFADIPEAIANTLEISSRLGFVLSDLGYEFPRYPVPPGETMNSFLRKRAHEGGEQRYRPYHERARRQIDRELQMIEKLNLAGYFLIVWDIIRFCREQGILAQGRGSAANSAVCYALGITAVDPVGMDLLFERFLSEERGEWPDIDIDLPSGDRRERVIQHVYERYGKLGAAMTANVITYRGRSAAREIGKALGFEVSTLERLSSLVRAWEWKDPKDTTERHFREAGLDLSLPRIRKFLELYQAVQDLPRHLGQHSGGMVICQGQLNSVVPLEPATMPGRVVVQWDKEDCADMGLIKVDLLGLGMMAVLEESIEIIRDAYGEEVDLAHLPQDDPAVYAALQNADTIGLFQVESRAQQACLPRHRPSTFYDIVVQVALIRPGPIVGEMVNPYLKRRQGLERPDCLHPSLEPVLQRTLGVPLFQEQLLRMAMIAAGFTGGEAEELRRAFGFKRSEKRMREVEVKLRAGMDRNGITGAVQDRIIQSITSFALYGFPESHSASFALLAYASGYIKCHYLAGFMAAMLNNQPMGFYHPAVLIKDAQRHGLRVLPVDVTKSEWLCTVELAPAPDPWPPAPVLSSVPVTHHPSPTTQAPAPVSPPLTASPCPRVAVSELPPVAPSPRLPVSPPLTASPRPRVPASELPPVAPSPHPPVSPSLTVSPRPRVPASKLPITQPAPGPRPPAPVLPAAPAAVRALRLGLLYARGLREEVGRAIVEQRREAPFRDIDDLARRVPELRKDEMNRLAEIGALNSIQGVHRRDALWKTERAGRPAGPLLGNLPDLETASPLAPMNHDERLTADFRGTGVTIGRHPMAFRRAEMDALGVTLAARLKHFRNGAKIRIAGSVIVRQRPGTAKGFVFLSMEDESGIANVIVTPDVYEQYRFALLSEPFLLIDGVLQNIGYVVSVKAARIEPLRAAAAAPSHDFH